MASPALIAVDWGTSSFRAYLMATGGDIVDEVVSSDGVSTLAPGAYPATLRRHVGRWLEEHPGLPILASGMVGSRNGWVETPYVACPAGPHDIAARLTIARADDLVVHLAPGLSCEDDKGLPDVMRGEEVEILGIAHGGAHLIVLPGSHSKWAAWGEGRVQRFKTFVTGEAFAAIRDHTIAGAFARAAPVKPPGSAFALGAVRGEASARGAAGQPGLLGALFGARSLPLTGKLAADDAAEYLSGLLIGAEIGEARRVFPGEVAHVAGAAPLVARYLAAFAALQDRACAAAGHAAARGLYAIAREGGFV